MSEKSYSILSQYIDSKESLKEALEFKRMLDYSIDNGAIDDGLITGFNNMWIQTCLEDIARFERWPNILNGSEFLPENGYRRIDTIDDDLYP